MGNSPSIPEDEPHESVEDLLTKIQTVYDKYKLVSLKTELTNQELTLTKYGMLWSFDF